MGTIAKQQGRRFPEASLLGMLSTRRLRVSNCLAESIHIIKSLRASGVSSPHRAFAFGAAAKTLRRSPGTLGSGSSLFILDSNLKCGIPESGHAPTQAASRLLGSSADIRAAMLMARGHQLILVSARKSRGGDHWAVDDYDANKEHR